MQWQEVKQVYPDRWLIVEALAAHTQADGHRCADDLAVIESCVDAKDVMSQYRVLHRQYPQREFYFVHTSREELDIVERWWLGVGSMAADFVREMRFFKHQVELSQTEAG